MDTEPKSSSPPLPVYPEWAPEDVKMLGEWWSSMSRDDNVKDGDEVVKYMIDDIVIEEDDWFLLHM
jgi:hypothetical protein